LDLKGFSATISETSHFSVNPAVVGDKTTPNGTKGDFTFFITLTKAGEKPLTTHNLSGSITPTPYTPIPSVTVSASPSTTVVKGSVVTLTATASDIANPKYEWYSNSIPSTVNAQIIAGATGVSYSPSTASTGTTYYYCVVNKTKSNVVGLKVQEVPTITTTALKGGVVGTAYTDTLTATGTTPITWAIATGTLPNGLSLDVATGVISGTPTASGTANITVKAINSAGEDTKDLTIAITEKPTITTTTLNDGVVGTAYSVTLAATGTAPITWAVSSGALPDGLTLADKTGV
ncbi:MAG: immunoglobulin domain-containing protein, partial [Oscillospiraceae bacterium]